METEEALRSDAAKVWTAACSLYPDLAYAFSRFKQRELFLSTVAALLSTLLSHTYHPGMGFEQYVRLLHCLLFPVGEYDPEDPRAQLRRLVLLVMARHQRCFRECNCDRLMAVATWPSSLQSDGSDVSGDGSD
ncbi:unnamed protein product [Symbiodinium natans]|uniref:Uncharacterized protein n=1 Tax=Symbiodinium natans TaxID=878477 RepID=A0A812T285_9DINO|nr:unnamed protein product [Symbiodinium natans]